MQPTLSTIIRGDATEFDQFFLQSPGVVGLGQPSDPFGRGVEGDSVTGLAGADSQADRQVRFASPGWAEEDHVLFSGNKIQGAEVSDRLAFERALGVEVELLQRFAAWEAGGADAAFTTVGFPGGDLALQASGQELLVGPARGLAWSSWIEQSLL